MTDQTIPADKVREIVDAMRASMRRAENTCSDVGLLDDMSVYIADLVTLLPAPPRPTLADMTDEEREACGWMQADVKGEDDSAVIYDPNWKDGSATVLWPNGFIEQADWENITPLPDLPRLEWPGDAEAEPAPALPDGWRLADHQTRGRVIVTRPEPDDDGEVCFVAPCVGFLGYGCCFCDPDELTYIDNDQKPKDAAPAKVGTVIESADDPRIDTLPAGSILLDRDEEATMKRPWEWEGEGYIPIPSDGDEFGPWTVLHIPKETDQ